MIFQKFLKFLRIKLWRLFEENIRSWDRFVQNDFLSFDFFLSFCFQGSCWRTDRSILLQLLGWLCLHSLFPISRLKLKLLFRSLHKINFSNRYWLLLRLLSKMRPWAWSRSCLLLLWRVYLDMGQRRHKTWFLVWLSSRLVMILL